MSGLEWNGTSLEELARELRLDILEGTYKAKCAHLGSCFSTVEILTALYFNFLNVDPARKTDPLRDRFILSKGHACLALYAALHRRGFIDTKTLEGFGIDGGTLEHHSKYNLDHGIELSTGSLGHGLPVACGMAHVAQDKDYRVVTLMSDGELGEGSNWEAILFAGHHKLDSLIAIVDYNKIQAMGNVKDILALDPLMDKFTAFGWKSFEVDGHNLEEVLSTLQECDKVKGQPKVIVANTMKGKGVSFMENQLLWHYRCPDPEELALAQKELGQ